MEMPFRIRTSKFRHVYGNPAKKEECYENVKITKSTHDSNFCAVNPKFLCVVPDTGGGGSFICLPLKQTGRVEFSVPRVCGHSGAVLDIKWSPFSDNIIASSSEDSTVKIWQIPDNLNKNLSEWQVDLHGHHRRVGYIEWHPTAENVILSAGFDHKCILWNVEQAEPISVISEHPDSIYSISWNTDGSLFCTTCKDKQIRVLDPRTGSVAMECQGHDGNRSSKSVFVDNNRIFTCGMTRSSSRELAVWDIRKFNKSLFNNTIDTSNGILLPYYDRDNRVMYLAGKGDSNIRYYEIDDQSNCYFLNAFMSSYPQRSLGVMPKRGCDTSRCEVMRFYKLHSGKDVIEPISMIVPRKVSSQFHSDIYPNTSSMLPSLTADEWIAGQNREPVMVSMLDGHVTNCPKTTSSTAIQNQQNDIIHQAPTITTYKTVNKQGMPPRANTIDVPRRTEKRPASLQNLKRLSTNEDYVSYSAVSEASENHINKNGMTNGHKEEKKVTKRGWSPISPTKDAMTNGFTGSEPEKFHVKKVWSTPPPSALPCQSPLNDVELQKAYFQQSEEIKSLKEQVKLKDKRIRQLEDELKILRTPSDCGPGQSDC
ncbi:coronin-6-like isoform X4 [Mytilus trossulus]|uniref:coronin-6-like isoform X4 n=1 Tax=Mytilus trossulus TaxID=6551 RepID=UPI003005A1E9